MFAVKYYASPQSCKVEKILYWLLHHIKILPSLLTHQDVIWLGLGKWRTCTIEQCAYFFMGRDDELQDGRGLGKWHKMHYQQTLICTALERD